MRQGNDVGTQYRSAVLWRTEEEHRAADASRAVFSDRLRAAGYPEITTEIAPLGHFYYAEDYHQQYLHKNPWGYCGLGGTGVSCPVGLGDPALAPGAAARPQDGPEASRQRAGARCGQPGRGGPAGAALAEPTPRPLPGGS